MALTLRSTHTDEHAPQPPEASNGQSGEVEQPGAARLAPAPGKEAAPTITDTSPVGGPGRSALETVARPPDGTRRFYLSQTSSLGWNGSVVTGYGYTVVALTAPATVRTGTNGSALRDLPPPPRPRRRRLRRRVARYDDQIRRRRKAAPARPVEVFRVRRVVRRVNVWSLARFAFVVYLCVTALFVTAAVGLWELASRSGAVPNIESFIAQLFAFKVFRFNPRKMFIGTLAIGLIWLFVAELLTVIVAVIFNLVSDVVGGVEFTILEELPIDKGSKATRAFGFLGLTVVDPAPGRLGNGSSTAAGVTTTK
jgi:hypothetical protein